MKELKAVAIERIVGGSHCKCSNGSLHGPSAITHVGCKKWCCNTVKARGYTFASAFTEPVSGSC